jgi:hypothetical protein
LEHRPVDIAIPDFGVELQRLAAERARLFEVAEETVIQQAAGESLPGDTG